MIPAKQQAPQKQNSPRYDGGYSYVSYKRRSKVDWAGVGVGDAFKANLDYTVRMPAQRLFFRAAKAGQAIAARLAGVSVAPGFAPKTKPQIGPFYTNYPSSIAAYGAIGLTAFLEYEEQASQSILLAYLAEYLANPAKQDEVSVDPEIYKRLAEHVTRTVQTRLILEDLAREPRLSSIEIYRLFSAAQQTLRWSTLPEILNAVILFGDLLPDSRRMALHPMTRAICEDIQVVSSLYFAELPVVKSREMVALGVAWVRAVCKRLAKYLPPAAEEEAAPAAGIGEPQRFSRKNSIFPPNDAFPPLDGPQPPTLFDPPSLAEQVEQMLGCPKAKPGNGKNSQQAAQTTLQETVAKALTNLSNLLAQAGGQSGDFEDMRADRVEQAFRKAVFGKGPMEGNPTDGHEVKVQLAGDQTAAGDIFDRPLEISDDMIAVEKLDQESNDLTHVLRKVLYPNVEQRMDPQRLQCSGLLDPARLALCNFSSTVFKRYRLRNEKDPHGRPVLLIACDGSASLNARQMRMTKVLTAAWLKSTAKSGVNLLAGLYHSGQVRQGLTAPLVQWIYHPHKSTAANHKEALRALASLPERGVGVQSDALSIAFMLEEAKRLSRGRVIYLILISDCAWNRSFQSGKEGREEVRELFASAYADFGAKLHTTLVALGVPGETGFETILDKVIPVADSDLENYQSVAGQIGTYVASCMRERKKCETIT